jgi:hypothetical protein
MFKDRKIVIATKHKKEKVLGPILERELCVKWFVSEKIDTDNLGTFSGEIERYDDPITTARNKCLMAIEKTGCDLAVASEGTFGMHPEIFFLPANDELLFFLDKKNNIEIIARKLSTATNHGASELHSVEELLTFAEKAGFPSHGIILKKSKNDFSDMIKGIIQKDKLISSFEKIFNKYGEVYAETDMRAMYNPTRMKVIEQAAHKLISKINSLCPDCNMPGFGITNAKQGLPCELCNCPTRSTLSYVYTCQKCSFVKEEKFPHGKMKEEATYCDVCNP